MVYADEIRSNVRLSLFRNDRLSAFGMTCMASALSSEHTLVGQRELYLFAGYVTPHVVDDSGRMTRPLLPDYRSLTRIPFGAFRPLYRHVNRFWHDKRSAFGGNELSEISYPPVEVPDLRRLVAEHPLDPRLLKEPCPLNRNSNLIGLFPQSAAGELWHEAALCPGPVTLCLGLPNVTAAARSPFENASVQSVSSPQLQARESATESCVACEKVESENDTALPSATQSGSGDSHVSSLSRLVGALFGRQPKPQLDPIPEEPAKPDAASTHDVFVRRWKQDEDTDEWIDHDR